AIHANDVVVLYGRCEADREIPYQPFAEALRWYILAAQPQVLREQVGGNGPELTRLVPALRLRLPDLPEPRGGTPDAEAEQLIESVIHTFNAVAERAAVLLVLDDLEQAGSQTLNMLQRLAESPPGSRMMVVALAGPAEEGTPWALGGRALAALPGSTQTALSGVSLSDVSAMLAQAGGVAAAPGLAERIHRETEGNPCFVSELLARMGEGTSSPEAVLDAACPYMGLRSFEANDSALYFGREEVVGALLGRLGSHRLLSVVGASGSGKSSLVRAGLVPQLRAGALPGSRDWDVLIMTPGANPLAELASRLAALAGVSAASVVRDLEADSRTVDLTVRQALANRAAGSRVVIVADQFEELFTLCRDEQERQQFIDALLHAVSVPDGRTMAILSMRADFYGEAARYPGLAEALEVSHALLGPMNREELLAAIERPAAVAGLRIEPGLADRILREVGDEPGGLPLLSHALLETWKRRDGRTLTNAGYAAAGGVRGAIAQTAETIYGTLSESEQPIARDLFVRLTELGEGSEDTRRRVSFAEVAPEGTVGERARAVITHLADARLLTTSTDSVEVAHEALIREWPRLRGWLDDDRDGLRVGRHLTESAQAWERLGRDPGELYRGTRLTAAAEWIQRAQPELNSLERAFLDESRELHEREIRDARARLRRLRVLATVASALFVVAVVVGGIAALQWRNANEQKEHAVAATDEAKSQRDLAQASALEATLARLETEIPVLLKTDRSLAFVLAAEAAKAAPGNRTTRLLNLVLGQDPRYLGRIWGTGSAPNGFAVSPDGKYFATRSADGLVELHDAAAKKVVASASTPEDFRRYLEFSPDGKFLAVLAFDLSSAPKYDLIVLDVPALTQARQFTWGGAGQPGLQPFSPDGDAFAALVRPQQVGGPTMIRLFNLRDGTERSVEIPGFTGGGGLAFDPTGRFVAAGMGSNVLAILDARTLQQLRSIQLPGVVRNFQFSPDGKSLLISGSAAAGTAGSTLQIWDPETGQLVEARAFAGS
ncbi:MAG: AAA family ATPase, partial [Anaerolineaceae bacterium]